MDRAVFDALDIKDAYLKCDISRTQPTSRNWVRIHQPSKDPTLEMLDGVVIDDLPDICLASDSFMIFNFVLWLTIKSKSFSIAKETI